MPRSVNSQQRLLSLDVFSWNESVEAQVCYCDICPALWHGSCKKKKGRNSEAAASACSLQRLSRF